MTLRWKLKEIIEGRPYYSCHLGNGLFFMIYLEDKELGTLNKNHERVVLTNNPQEYMSKIVEYIKNWNSNAQN